MIIKHLIFDLDNTLYPSTAKLDDGITERMIAFVASWLKTDIQTATILRAEGVPRYGTTLEWLMREAGLKDIELYFRAVHPAGEEAELEANPEERELLSSLLQSNLTLSVLTNAPTEHAVRILKKLEIFDLFSNITDIRTCSLRGKPYKSAYETALNAIGGSINDTLFFDDHIKYTDAFAALGGTAVLVGKNSLPVDAIHASSSEEKSADAKRWENEAIYSETKIAGRIFHISSIFDVKNLLQQITLL